MPDDAPLSMHVTLRVPSDVVEAFDRLAKILDRPRSWVLLRALRSYLEEEGTEIFEDAEALADDGETISAEEMIAEMREIIGGDGRKGTKPR